MPRIFISIGSNIEPEKNIRGAVRALRDAYGVLTLSRVYESAPQGFSGDFRRAEWAGCCFSPDGKWLFANVYKPGFTVAITGPWKTGLV